MHNIHFDPWQLESGIYRKLDEMEKFIEILRTLTVAVWKNGGKDKDLPKIEDLISKRVKNRKACSCDYGVDEMITEIKSILWELIENLCKEGGIKNPPKFLENLSYINAPRHRENAILADRFARSIKQKK
jgi:hypothetical protein